MNLVIKNVVAQLDTPSIRANSDIEAIKAWLLEFKNSSNTFISYRQTAERFLMWIIKQNLKLTNIKREDINEYQEFLKAPTPQEFWCGPSKPRIHPDWKPFVKGLSPSSIKLNLQILTSMYEYLLQSGYLNINPFRLIKFKSAMVTKNKSIDRYLTHKEWQYVINYIENMPKQTNEQKYQYHRIKWLFILLYLTGCRRNEIANAKMSDFFHRHGNWWLKVIGKGNKYGEVPVTNQLLQALIEYRKSINLSDFPSLTETNISLINNINFKNQKYLGLTDSMLYKLIKQTCSNIAISLKESDPTASFIIMKVSTHWLRHTSATHQVDAGIDIRVVKDNLRHSMLETTMKYQHTESNKRHKETQEKFGI